ncbi:uncharacterized protein RCC_08403 [Ramularia collo-cygni]|uniref:Guanine nucleotide-binding protein-like 3 N-terminal domain-containing protein n=1 Tax=Ramularia collo-cygni TaxID=112498 RepID=A0A2D3VMA3_9PEZI|nr:uncharacterized protein RCC_08403 [Ramularia collo-cygni]CZT22698.1 uncharacterized protein RCC_08403 [Ramularia collo-cygni]
MPKVGKPKSKRIPVRLRHKIEKSSAAKQRKQRKDGKKNPQWTSRLKKDPGIPNLFPFKDKILAEVEESKRRKEEELVRRRQIAKAQREGRTLAEVAGEEAAAKGQQDGDDELMDPMDDGEDVDADGDEAMDDDSSNPMAALVASAQARAMEQSADADEEEDEDEDEEADDNDLLSKGPTKQKPATRKAPVAPVRKTLPKQALEDPVKAVTTLVTRLQARTTEPNPAIKVVVDYYAIPALPELPPTEPAAPVTSKKPAGKSPADRALENWTTRFLVEVARKRGRLGKGGIPNLNAAALTVLGDINEGRLVIPAAPKEVRKNVSAGDSTVTIVETMAEPFRIEGLFGDSYGK